MGKILGRDCCAHCISPDTSNCPDCVTLTKYREPNVFAANKAPDAGGASDRDAAGKQRFWARRNTGQ